MIRLFVLAVAALTIAACDMNIVAPPASEAGDARNDLDAQDPNIKN